MLHVDDAIAAAQRRWRQDREEIATFGKKIGVLAQIGGDILGSDSARLGRGICRIHAPPPRDRLLVLAAVQDPTPPPRRSWRRSHYPRGSTARSSPSRREMPPVPCPLTGAQTSVAIRQAAAWRHGRRASPRRRRAP